MTDRPILFSAPMIRALLAGAKTQTRRVIKPQPPADVVRHCWYDAPLYGFTRDHDVTRDWHIARLAACTGDRLWVREAWRSQEAFDELSPNSIIEEFLSEIGAASIPTLYEADKQCDGHSIEMWQQSPPGRLRASMHMPRCASRLTLTVTDVRVERLQDISEEDAKAEGVTSTALPLATATGTIVWHVGSWPTEVCGKDPIGAYASLWNAINGPGSWEANPWVAAYTFTVHRCNIDQMAEVRS